MKRVTVNGESRETAASTLQVLLADLGYGLDVTRCTVTGAPDDLAYVSPRTGRAVSREAGAPYAERLLPLPRFLLGSQAGGATLDDLRHGFDLTGHFLARHLLQPFGKELPPARDRYIRLALERAVETAHSKSKPAKDGQTTESQ